eukprot:TRINITY_DN104161_c0_g1_i1.p2 TRINITY_DN104161_c0_g1~~TRINITY_DN104161_c0_g1_i1.p2  ORF type:complete len:168 (+),score=40.86 TRINITY_DN104161_c0_g1_i1:169-672(+)
MQNQNQESLRSKGILPAVGVGAAVYLVTGVVSLSTLGLVGVGAGVGYGVGSWLAEKYQDAQDKKNGGKQPHGHAAVQGDIPWALQVSIQQWQVYLQARIAGGPQPTPQQIEGIFEEFAAKEPVHAQNVRGFVHAAGGAGAGGVGGSTPVMQSAPGGPMIVPTQAAEV